MANRESQLADAILERLGAKNLHSDVILHALTMAAINFSLGVGMSVDRFCEAAAGSYQDYLDQTGKTVGEGRALHIQLSADDQAKITPLAKEILDTINQERVNENVALAGLAMACIRFCLQVDITVDQFCCETRDLYQEILDQATKTRKGQA